MERETKKLTTPNGKEVELKTYLTARENRQVREAYLASVHPEFDENGKAVTTKISGVDLSKAEDVLVEVSIVSYDGSKENIVSRILDGSPEDYNFIVQESSTIRRDFQTAK